ncbi:MAG: tRNA (adenosine(37)-N6)-dimethylallyltransferase MiaA [candidate division KSB1 bacterium]|nr:tRNA (adenosine(37)-N6)-dimethylallyltransferase MiaA [candidate division KSB1 bacterium]
MSDLNVHKVLIIVGPTAVGKTEITLKTAEKLDCEIVSADSRQIYRYMDIGTAKPTPEELSRVPHHFIDCRNPDRYFSAGEYGRQARRCIHEIQNRNKQALVAGGAGFYVQALVDGLFAPGRSDPAIKQKWRQKIRDQGRDRVFKMLQHVDPETAARLHPNDTQRVVRALEVYELTGTPLSRYRALPPNPADFVPIFIGLYRQRKTLYTRIEHRVDCMIEQGLVDEVRRLRDMGYTPEYNALRTVGYREVFDYLNGKFDKQTMIEQIKINSRHYAKRQLTWFRKDDRIHWLDLHQYDDNSIVNELLMYLKDK